MKPSHIVYFLGACALTMNVTWFMSYPLLPVYLTSRTTLTLTQIGVVLGAVSMAARLLPFAGGMVADRTSQASCLMIGLGLRSLGFFAFALVREPYQLVIPLSLHALGGVLFDPSIRALISQLPEQERAAGFARLNLFLNAGVIGGPLLGAVLSTVDGKWPFLASGILMAALFTVGGAVWRRLRELGQVRSEKKSWRAVFGPLGQPRFGRFAFSVIVSGLLLSQIYYALPLYNYLLSNSLKDMSTVYMVNGAIGLVAMFFLQKTVQKRSPLALSAVGVALVGLALLSIPVVSASWWLLTCIAVFTIGETLILPTQEIYTSSIAEKDSLGQYFGTLEMCSGLGATLATTVGPAFAEWGARSVWPWLALGALALALSATYANWARREAIA